MSIDNDFNTLLSAIWPKTFPTATAVVANGTPILANAIHSTFSGFSVPFDWDGTAFDMVGVWYSLEKPGTLLSVEVRDSAHVLKASGQLTAYNKVGFAVVRLDKEVNSGIIPVGVVYVAHQSLGGVSRLSTFAVGDYVNVADTTDYHQKYTTTTAANNWTNAIPPESSPVPFRLYHSSSFNPSDTTAVPTPDEMIMTPRWFVLTDLDGFLYFANMRSGQARRLYSATTGIDSLLKLRGGPREEFVWKPSTSIDLIYTLPSQLLAPTTLTLACHDPNDFLVPLGSVAVSFDIISSAGAPGATKKVLALGDSTWANGRMTQAMLDIAGARPNSVQFAMIGTQGLGAAKHEAHSGWDTGTYFANALSPFLNNGNFDVSYYLSHNNVDMPDIVLWGLGINTEFGQSTEVGAHNAALIHIQNTDKMIGFTSVAGVVPFRTAAPQAKHLLCVPIPPTWSEDGWGWAYNIVGTNRSRWRQHANMLIMAKTVIEYYRNRESDNIYLVPMFAGVDMHYGVPKVSGPASPYSNRTVDRENEGTHPSNGPPGGYEQMASVIVPFINGIQVRGL